MYVVACVEYIYSEGGCTARILRIAYSTLLHHTQIVSHHFSLKHLGSDRFSFNYMLYLPVSKFRGTSVFKGIPSPIDEQYQVLAGAPHTPVWHFAISVLSLFLWLSQPPILMSMLSGKQLNLSCTNWLLGRFHNKIPAMAVYCSRVVWSETSSYLLTHSI